VQSGSYLGEDDIVRFEDRYGRVPKGWWRGVLFKALLAGWDTGSSPVWRL